ncbi:MAG: hypothetical protein ACRDTG_29730 [Pseudonocardiaceae bacterium]
MATSTTSGLVGGVFRAQIVETLAKQRGLVGLEAARMPWSGM